MLPGSTRRCAVAFLLALFLSGGGCAHRGPGPVPSEADRAGMRTVGVSAGTHLPAPSFLVPAKGAGQGALLGGGMALGAPLGAGSYAGPVGLLAGAGVGAAAAPFGAAYGAANAMPAEEAVMSEEKLRGALAGLDIQASLRDRLLAEGRAMEAQRTFKPVGRGPAGPSDNVVYGTPADEGCDVVLEVQATRLGLRGSAWGSDPPMEFFLDVKARLVRTRDHAVLWNRTEAFRSPARRVSQWVQDGGRRLRGALEEGTGEIAERIIEEVFFLVPLP